MSPQNERNDTMKNTAKIAALFLAASVTLAPATANAMGDNMFGWPVAWPGHKVEKQEKVDYGTTGSIEAFAPIKAKKAEKEKQPPCHSEVHQ